MPSRRIDSHNSHHLVDRKPVPHMWAIQNVILAVTSAKSARIVMRSEAIDGDKIVEESENRSGNIDIADQFGRPQSKFSNGRVDSSRHSIKLKGRATSCPSKISKTNAHLRLSFLFIHVGSVRVAGYHAFTQLSFLAWKETPSVSSIQTSIQSKDLHG
jgi:hypothetical protein